MDGVVIAIVVIVVIVVIGVVAFLYLQAKAKKDRAAKQAEAAAHRPADPFAEPDLDAALRGNPTEITPGDLVEIRGHSWAVRGTLRLREGSFEWAEHLLDDADGVKRWLSVEEDPDLVVVLWTGAPSEGTTPGQKKLTYGGKNYTKEESGNAGFRSVGTTGLDETGAVVYHDYTGSDDSLLSFEDYGNTGKWEAATGEQLNRYELRIYPGN